MLRLGTFDEEEFVNKVPYSLDTVYFLIFMDSARRRHHAAFVNLITKEADFSSAEIWNSNLTSASSTYWALFCQKARSFPPLNFEYVKYIKLDMVADLAPCLSFTEFLYFLKPEYWYSLTKDFLKLNISIPILVNYFSILQDSNILRYMPSILNRDLSWPALHLAVLSDNLEAAESLISIHPQFS